MLQEKKKVSKKMEPVAELKYEKRDQGTEEMADNAPQPVDQETGGGETKKLEELTRQMEKKNDQLLRIAAEYDNYKKRTERERLETASYATASLIKELLPAVDNIKRALEVEDTETPEFSKGAVIIMKQLLELLGKQGLSEIDPQGQQFNPEEHEAVMHIEDEAFGENEVAQVLQKGYKLGDTILRPAMVKVAN